MDRITQSLISELLTNLELQSEGSSKDFEKLVNYTVTRIKKNGSFTEISTQNFRGSNTHNKFLAKISSYWIYRIRSSIAHRKLGEYVMDQKDEKFVVNFAEPLIKAIYRDFFINFNYQDT